MSATLLAAITLTTIGWSLWIRRATWSCRWEVAATLNIALQGVAVLLMLPWVSVHFGLTIYRFTGEMNLQNYIAHDCYIVAASAIVYNNLGRLEARERFQWAFRQYVERPATLCIPLMLATFTMGNGDSVYRPDFFDVPCDIWLTLYWILFCGTVVYLLSYGVRSLLILRSDARSKNIANVYLIACINGIAACLIRIYCCFDYDFELGIGNPLTWTTACLCGGIFAAASGYSWLEKVRWFTRAQTMERV